MKKHSASQPWLRHAALLLLPGILIFFSVLSIIQRPSLVLSQTNEGQSSADEIIVKYKSTVRESDKSNLRKQFGAILSHKNDKLRLDVLKVKADKKNEYIQTLKQNPLVEYAEPNFIAKTTSVSNDSSLASQWGLFKINAANTSTQSAWDITHGDPSIKVAILDTGIDESHPDLSAKVTAQADFTGSSTVTDENGHGSHTAGIAAALTNNSTGVAGAAYNTSLMNGKVLGADGSGYYSWIVNGITWAADNGANVISMSLGGSSSSLALQDAINYAWSKGVVIVAAAGNSGSSSPNYPGYYSNVIAVAATDSNDVKASWSNYGSWVDVAAPGVSIYSTYKNASYATMSGTSMATPFVAGEAALIWASGICSTNSCVRSQIEQTADHTSGTGTYFTFGRINAYKAVQALDTIQPTTTPTPTTAVATLTPTPTNTPTPTATPTPALLMTVKDIAMSYVVLSSTSRRVITAVTVINETTGKALSNASVSLQLRSPNGTVYNFSGTTNLSGKINFRQKTTEKGTFTATVTNVNRTGYTYHPTLTSKSLLVQ